MFDRKRAVFYLWRAETQLKKKGNYEAALEWIQKLYGCNLSGCNSILTRAVRLEDEAYRIGMNQELATACQYLADGEPRSAKRALNKAHACTRYPPATLPGGYDNLLWEVNVSGMDMALDRVWDEWNITWQSLSIDGFIEAGEYATDLQRSRRGIPEDLSRKEDEALRFLGEKGAGDRSTLGVLVRLAAARASELSP